MVHAEPDELQLAHLVIERPFARQAGALAVALHLQLGAIVDVDEPAFEDERCFEARFTVRERVVALVHRAAGARSADDRLTHAARVADSPRNDDDGRAERQGGEREQRVAAKMQ